MEKSNKMENQDILTAYSNYVTENNERPHSIASFSKLIGVEESELYKYYTTFDKIESLSIRFQSIILYFFL